MTNSDATPQFNYWTFSSSNAVQPDQLGGDSVRVAHVWQFSIPIDVAIPIGDRFTVDASGAYQTGTVQLAGAGHGAPYEPLHAERHHGHQAPYGGAGDWR